MKIFNFHPSPGSSDWINKISVGQLPGLRIRGPTKSPTHKAQQRPRLDVSVLQLSCG